MGTTTTQPPPIYVITAQPHGATYIPTTSPFDVATQALCDHLITIIRALEGIAAELRTSRESICESTRLLSRIALDLHTAIQRFAG